MAQLYVPQRKIVLASSFEGVVNNGARECAFVSFNAFERMRAQGSLAIRGFFNRQLTPDEFRESSPVKNSAILKAFLALRPLGANAEDYLTILMALRSFPEKTLALSRQQDNPDLIIFFIGKFNEIKAQTASQRAAFRTEFYAVRKETQGEDYNKWLALQEPFTDTLEQLRTLNGLKTVQGGQVQAGFVLYFITSKDEASTFQLCTVYSELGHFKEGELVQLPALKEGESWPALLEGAQTCLISPARIIGKDKVAGADKVLQMQMAAQLEGVEPSCVWRLQDRIDAEEMGLLNAAGFTNQLVVTGGYAFPQDIENAKKMGVPIIEKANLAQALSEYAREKGF